jgi:Cdc6-like AAA superfamily ATPase
MTDFIVGSPARDDDFCFREEFLEDLWEAVEKHNVLLLAPRRTGKTSVMYRMLDRPKESWLPIHLNVEDLKTPGDFIISLIDAINEHQPAYMRNTLAKGWKFVNDTLSRVERIEVSEFKFQLRKKENPEKKWQDRGNELIDRVIRSDKRVLFIIDELPDMLNSMFNDSHENYDIFLHWFRKIRDRSLKHQLRWLVGGSVNLIAALDQQGMVKQVNDLKSEPLPPFTNEEITEFVKHMLGSRDVRFDETVIPRIQDLLGTPIPLFLQMLTEELYRLWKRDKSRIMTATQVEEAYNKSLLGEMARDKLQHYRSRIDVHYLPDDREAACYFLSKMSLIDTGLSHRALFQLYRQIEDRRTAPRTGPALSQAFQRLMLHLQSDFYIEPSVDGAFDFASRLLKNWWKKYYSYECEVK